MSASVATPPRIEVSHTSGKDADYEDDFEDELDSFISTSEEQKLTEQKDNKTSDNKQDSDVAQANSSDSPPEKGSEEIEKGQKEYSESPVKKKADTDHEGDDYTFSDDQKRAMMELMAQRQESDLPDEDPPEYDVKDRLIQLNAELAQESEPEERQHRVGFKDTLVDLVAPPPDFSDDEDSQRDRVSPAESKDTEDDPRKSPDNPRKSPDIPEKNKSSENEGSKKKKKTVVVERDGKFEVVNIEDLTPTEREIYDVRDSDSPVIASEPKKSEKNTNNSNLHAQSKQPSPPRQQPTPPRQPRPATANGHTNRRQLRPVKTKQRPKSAATEGTRHETSLENFTYTSPYALTPKQKELSDQRAKALEEKRREEEKRKRKEKEEEQRENEEAFQAWLKQKREEQKKKKDEEDEEKKKQAKEDKDCSDSEADSLTKRQRELLESEQEEPALESFEQLFQKQESEEAYEAWLKNKRAQLKREKLLKRRQDQEMRDCYHTCSRDECERAFKAWVKDKNKETRKLRASEKQKNKSARAATRRSRKNAALLRAIRNSQSFQYVDYYGYRF